MPSLDTLTIANAPLRVRDVSLAPGDDAKTRREKLARIVLDEMTQFVGLLDADGNILEINRAALEGTGVAFEDIRGTPFWAGRWWAGADDAQQFHRDLVQRAAQGEFVRCDVELTGGDHGHEKIAMDYSLLPVKDHAGRVVFLIPEARDITEKKRAEGLIGRKTEELQGRLDQVRHLDQLKSDLFANVSHELRTPLALILGPTEAMLAAGENLSEPQRRNLTVVHRNAAALLKHVNDLLDLAKFDAGQMSMAYERIDAGRALRRVGERFHALVPQRSMTFVVATPDRLEAELDPAKFDRIVVNLLSNAFKFTPDGGRIRCTLAARGRERLVLTVHDSGPGVRAELRAAIFDRFRQAQSGTRREHAGTGLGLAIAKEFVALHGGTIAVDDADEGGALFQVELPRRAPADAPVREAEGEPWHGEAVVDGAVRELHVAHAESPHRARASGKSLVLVAEDDPEMRRFIGEVLGDECNVVAAADGEQALARAIAEPPDLVVTDLMMPRLGGDALVAEMRARDALAQVPVLVLSAKADEALRAMLLAESVQDYVDKPFSPHELRARVRNLLAMKLARDALQKELASQTEDLGELARQLVANRLALAQAQSELARVTRVTALGELAASIAHEVNQPLAAIVANGHACVRWLEASPPNGGEVQAAVRDIIRDANRASAVIARIRGFLKRGDTQRAPVHLGELLSDVIALTQDQARSHAVSLRGHWPSQLPAVLGDRVQLQQVVLNLVLNAIEAMSGIAGRERVLQLSAAADGADGVCVGVRDCGPGLDAAQGERIFDAFYTTKPQGMGMGLAISRSIVESHGGRLWASSNADAPGTTFRFTLPVAAAADGAATS